jgi:hypothetical protein
MTDSGEHENVDDFHSNCDRSHSNTTYKYFKLTSTRVTVVG